VTRSELAFQLRIQLLCVLAPNEACAECGANFCLEDLEIDHRDGRTWDIRRLNFLDRIRRQWREYWRGVRLRALCRSCNAADGNRRWHGRARYGVKYR
jgi:hypothetical protein